jgi:hypothetical protein
MNVLLLGIPLFAIISGLLMYRFTGRREIMKLDIVQFFFAFVIAPVFFVWLKTLLFVVVRDEVAWRISIADVFVIDSIMSVVFLYIYAFVVIHSLTKTFHLNWTTDPLYDVFEHSEFYHQLLSHVVIYVGAMIMLSLLSTLNLIFPFTDVPMDSSSVYALCGFGSICGLVGFISIWQYETEEANFMRLMKLAIGSFFLWHVGVYFWTGPRFDLEYSVYWWATSILATMTLLSLFAERREHRSRWLQMFPFALNWSKPKYLVRSMTKLVSHR